jgi:hypothetical protein
VVKKESRAVQIEPVVKVHAALWETHVHADVMAAQAIGGLL